MRLKCSETSFIDINYAELCIYTGICHKTLYNTTQHNNIYNNNTTFSIHLLCACFVLLLCCVVAEAVNDGGFVFSFSTKNKKEKYIYKSTILRFL